MDVASLAAFRCLFGVLMALAVGRYFAHGWIHAQFEAPTFHFTYPGLAWVRPLPAPWMRVVFGLVGAAAILVALGWCYRAAIVTFALGFTWIHLCEATNYLNHYWLVTLVAVLMAFLPMADDLSLDARWGRIRRRPVAGPWALGLLRFQIAAVYGFAGLAKLGEDWLLRGEPLRTWLAVAAPWPWAQEVLAPRWVAIAGSWAGMAFDLAIAFLVLWRRTRTPAFAVLVLFHVATALLFPIGLFPWFMTAFATIFLAPGWPRRWLGSPPPPPTPLPRLGAGARWGVGAWVLVQLALPLRHHVLPEDPLWAERGARFSWRVMLAEKWGEARFFLHDPAEGRSWVVDPLDELTPVQARQMATQPDLLLQYAGHLADRERRRGRLGIEVRVRARVALNGRPSRDLVDPSRDVAHEPHDVVPLGWVTAPP